MDVVDLASHPEVERLRTTKQLPELTCSDLMKKAFYELDFLRLIDQNRHLYYNENFIKYALIRYEKYWMPFLAEKSSQMETDLKFAPPLDIHWVWHVHMLAPVQYSKDCTACVGKSNYQFSYYSRFYVKSILTIKTLDRLWIFGKFQPKKVAQSQIESFWDS